MKQVIPEKQITLKTRDENQRNQKDIELAPRDKVIREFYQNVIECPEATKAFVGPILVDGFDVPKQCFINNGRGMTAFQLFELHEIYGSHKNIDRDMNGNNNTGVRLTSLGANMLGTSYVSMFEGKINGCMFWRDEDYNPFFRMLSEDFDPYNLLKDYSDLLGGSKEWTAVITLGMRKDQNTFLEPVEGVIIENHNTLIIENRYYSQPMSKFDNQTPIKLNINGKEIIFYKELVDSVETVNYSFTTDEAHYEIEYSENWGEVIPKSGIVHKNELFDVRWQDQSIEKLISNSTSIMREIGAGNLKNELSIIIHPIVDSSTRMDGYRVNVKKEGKDLTMSSFTKDLNRNMRPDLLKLIQDSNNNNNTTTTLNIMSELLSNLNDVSEVNGNPKITFEDIEKVVVEDVELTELEKLELKYPYIKYDIDRFSELLSLTKDELRSEIKSFSKGTKLLLKSSLKNPNIFKENIKTIISNSESIYTTSITNIVKDLIKLNKNGVENKAKVYFELIKLFLERLKNDIKDKKDNKGDCSSDIINLTPLEVEIISGDRFLKETPNIGDPLKTFGYYTERTIILNKDSLFVQKWIEFVNLKCIEQKIANIDDQIALDSLSDLMKYMGAYYNKFGVSATRDELRIECPEKLENRIFQMASQHMKSDLIFVKNTLNKELDLTIEKMLG